MPLNNQRTLDFIETLRKMKQTFEVEYTGNTITIDYKGKKTKFIESYLNKKIFAAHKKIKDDVNGSDKLHDIITHDKKNNIWYSNRNFIPECYESIVIHIDLRSAYIRALLNNKIIKKDTYEYVNSLEKIDRLISLGLFAKSTEIRKYAKGDIISIETIEQPLENVFYYSAYNVDLIMEELKSLLKDFYIFYWFDGIYAFPNSNVERIATNFLVGNNYDFKIELLKNFAVVKEFPKIHFSFKQWEAKENTWKDKNFSFSDKSVKKMVELRIKAILDAEKSEEIDYYKTKFLQYEQIIKNRAIIHF